MSPDNRLASGRAGTFALRSQEAEDTCPGPLGTPWHYRGQQARQWSISGGTETGCRQGGPATPLVSDALLVSEALFRNAVPVTLLIWGVDGLSWEGYPTCMHLGI